MKKKTLKIRSDKKPWIISSDLIENIDKDKLGEINLFLHFSYEFDIDGEIFDGPEINYFIGFKKNIKWASKFYMAFEKEIKKGIEKWNKEINKWRNENEIIALARSEMPYKREPKKPKKEVVDSNIISFPEENKR